MVPKQPVLAMLVMAVAAPGHSQGGGLLQPIKPWVLNYADTECFAERQYGNSASPIVLAFRGSVAGDVYEILIGRRGSGPKFAEHRNGSIDFGYGKIDVLLLQYPTKDNKLLLQKYRLTGPILSQVRKATQVRFTVREGPDTAFSLAAMPALFKGMDDCIANLRQYWNSTADTFANVATPAEGSLTHLFKSEDYPGEALSRNQQGSGQFLLLIDEKGKIAGCDVATPSGIPSLDAMGCQVIRERAKFNPALDRSGKPIRSVNMTPSINWRLSR